MTDHLIEQLRLQEELLSRLKSPTKLYLPSAQVERDQLSFHQSPATIRMLSGGNQSGKTVANAAEITFYLKGEHPYSPLPMPKAAKVWSISASYRTLYEGVWRHLNPMSRITGAGVGFLEDKDIIKMGPKVPLYDIPTYIEVRNKFGFTSRLDFISGEGADEARKKMQAAAIDLVSIDEEISDELFNELLMRILAKKGRVIITATLLISGEVVIGIERRAEEGDPNVLHIRLNTAFNQHLDSTFVKEIFANLSEEEKEVRLYGRSRKSQGLIYSNFDSRHVVTPFDIPPDWPRFRGMDPGWRTFAVLWIAVDPSTYHSYVYRELYEHNATLDEVIGNVLAVEKKDWDPEEGRIIFNEHSEVIETTLIDPAAFSHSVSGEIGPGAKIIANYGIPCIPAQNNVYAGIETVRQWYKDMPDGIPGLRVFNTCSNFLSERRAYKIAPNNNTKTNDRPDKPLKRKDHLMDCKRYVAMHLLGVSNQVDKGIGSSLETFLNKFKVSPKGPIAADIERTFRVSKSYDEYA